MSRHPRSNSDPGIFAVLHHAGGSWRAVVARRSNGRLEIADSRRFADEDANDLQAYLEARKVEAVISVLPSSSVVCRTCTLPDAEPAALAQAINLQAETHLLGTTESHRVAAAVLEIAPGETSRTGIIVAWPSPGDGRGSAATGTAPVVTPPVTLPMTYAPDVAALAALLNGYRPADPLFWVDRATGSVALALTHAAGAVIRATREEGDTTSDWMQNATRALAETALSVGHSSAFAHALVESYQRHLSGIGERGARLVVPAEVAEAVSDRVDGAESSDEWWAEFGVAAGVAIAATGELAPLTKLEGSRAIETPSRVESITRALSRPRTALVTTLVGLVIIALLPLAASGVRLTVLRSRYPDLEQRTRAIGQTESRLAMYSALEKETWSMTKLLSDVVSNTPQGIELDSIRLQHSDQSVFVAGRAGEHEDRTATEVIALMQVEMRDSGLFDEIKLNWDEPNNFGHHDFELSAKITAPHRRVKYAVERDYAKWTLAQRQGGEGPPAEGDETDPVEVADAGTEDVETTPTPTPAGPDSAGPAPAGTPKAAADPETSKRSGRGPRVPVSGVGGVASGAEDRSDPADRGLGGRAPGAVPAPLSDDQIAAMTPDQISASLVEVAKAKNRIRREDDPELFDRLAGEFKKLMARRREGT